MPGDALVDDPPPNGPTDEPAGAAPAVPDLEAIISAHEGRTPTQWGVDIAGVVRTVAEAGAVYPDRVFLTLDACGGPAGSGFDQRLIEGLRAAAVPALLFVNYQWITAHPAVMSELAGDSLFTLGNHGTRHLPLSVNGNSAYGITGTATVREAVDEVWHNHQALTELTGTPPHWFRPGTAHLDDVALSITEALGERVLGFSVNGDAGATYPAPTVAAQVGAAAPGSVVIAHFNQPGSGTADGVLAAVNTLRGRGLEFGAL